MLSVLDLFLDVVIFVIEFDVGVVDIFKLVVVVCIFNFGIKLNNIVKIKIKLIIFFLIFIVIIFFVIFFYI